jgi:chemotaxis protein methyltransferase CheR
LAQLSEMIVSTTALYFPKERWGDLECRMGSAAKEFGFTGKEEFIQWLLSSPLTASQMDILASHLTVHETYFWREPQVFEALVTRVLPEFARSHKNGDKRLRIWSAGCATGEEPYSIAIALRRSIPELKECNITILATDINPRILRKAMAGVYGQWSFRNAPPWLIGGYFHRKKDGVFEVLPEIRKMVTFACLNLAEDIYPALLNNTNAMDIIFCRNVIMYFAPERARQVGQGLYRSLVDGGWLMVGASELSQALFPQFAPVQFPGAIAYRKETRRSPLPAVLSYEAPAPSQVPAYGKTFITAVEPLPQNEFAPFFEQPAQAIGVEITEKTGEETSPSKAPAVRALADQGRLTEALALCEGNLASDKLNPGLHYLRAIILQELDRIEDADVSLKRTLYLDRNFLLAHFALGHLGLRQGKARAAKKHFENVLALLKENRPEDILPESEGLTAGRFREIINAAMETGASA